MASPSESTPVVLENPSTPNSVTPALELAQQLSHQLSIQPDDWHRLKSNRRARALEQTAVALVYLLTNQSDEGLARLQQAVGWLDRSISAPPCPTHGHRPQ
jgi:hypothetical protein